MAIDARTGRVTDPRLRHLFEPITIGNTQLPNRICWSAHSTHYASNGLPSDTQIAYYEERARGGAGWIVIGGSVAHESQLWEQGFNLVTDPRASDGYRRLTEAVHRHGARITTQLSTYGIGVPHSRPYPGPTYSPSNRLGAIEGEMPKMVDEDDMQMFIDAAVRGIDAAMDAGFDGIEELASFDTSLLQNFLSPRFNNRADEYGGSLENRMRFPLRLLTAMRKAVGIRGHLGLKLIGDEMIDGGLDQEEIKEICRRIDQAGLVDYFHVCFGTRANFQLMLPDMTMPAGFAAYLAAGVREVVNVPVVAVKRFDDPLLASQVIADGHADIIGMTRALIADPELPNKARDGKLDLIRQCTSSNQECGRRAEEHIKLPLRCVQNPAVGFEATLGTLSFKRAERSKRVVVIGGGPGGMRAAKVAAQRGHEVHLFERGARLGGQVLNILKVPARAGYESVIRYLAGEIERRGVQVHLGHEATAESVLALEPEAVIVATGSRPQETGFSPATPHIERMPGVDQDHVLTVFDVFSDPARVKGDVILIDELAQYEGQVVAEHIANLDRKLTFVTRHPVAGAKVDGTSLAEYATRLAEHRVRYHVNTAVREIDGHIVSGVEMLNGDPFEQHADTVVLVMGRLAEDRLYHELKGRVRELHRVGDCVAPRQITEAIFEGNLAARQI